MAFETFGQGVPYYPWLPQPLPQDINLGLNHIANQPIVGSSAGGGAIYTLAPSTVPCGGSITLQPNQPSYIFSPRFPDNYPPNFHCTWQIKVAFGNRIALYFEELLLPSSDVINCHGDRVQIDDMHYTQKYCYYNFGGFYMSVSPSIVVNFQSDSTREAFPSRFRIRLELVSNWCGGEIAVTETTPVTLRTGNIATPNYPQPYATNVVCSWRIKTATRWRIRLTCQNPFWLEHSHNCLNDFLAISLSGDETMKDSNRYCGFNGPGSVAGESNILTLIFHSNGQYVFGGFSCQYDVVDPAANSNGLTVAANNLINSVTVGYSNVFNEHPTNYYPTTLSQLPRSQTCDCGTANTKGYREARIVGGSQTEINAYPWVVAIFKRDGRQYCAGSLINELFVVTASHCVARLSPSEIYTSLGDHDLDSTNDGRNSISKVRRILIHPGYKSTPVETDDIALLELTQPALLSGTIRPICLPPPDLDIKGQTPTVIGWGKLSEGGQSTSILRETTLPILPNVECQRAYGFSVVNNNMICAGQLDGSKDACQGDSGGPMMVIRQSRWYMIGLVSYGFGCARPEFPGVYTRIDKYLDWIRIHTETLDYICSAVPPTKTNLNTVSNFNKLIDSKWTFSRQLGTNVTNNTISNR
ncbi:Mannan-binding lectin serine protease 1 [Chamberlinius hualienensis]